MYVSSELKNVTGQGRVF